MNAILNMHANQGRLDTVGRSVVAEGSTVPIAVSFSSDWDGLDVTGVFENETSRQDVPVVDGLVTVPDEFVTTPHFFVTMKGGLQLTTNKFEVRVNPSLKGVS